MCDNNEGNMEKMNNKNKERHKNKIMTTTTTKTIEKSKAKKEKRQMGKLKCLLLQSCQLSLH